MSARPRQWLVPALLALAALLALRALLLCLADRVALSVVLGPGPTGLQGMLVGLAVAVAATLWALAMALRASSDAGRRLPSTGATLRQGFVVLVLAWLLFAALVDPFQRLWFELAAGAAAGVWALSWIAASAVREATAGRPRLARTWHVWGIGLFGVCAAALGLESGLRGWARLAPSPLNVRVGAGPRELIRRFRLEPGQVHIGFACNSRGFYDDEFHLGDSDDRRLRVASIGDSFNVGAVPHARHFTTRCEELSGARVDNIGVPGIGPAEYLSLLVDEALPLEPDLVLIDVFVGNDLNVADTVSSLPDPALRAWFQGDRVLLFVLPRRLARLARERERRRSPGGEVGAVQGEDAAPGREGALDSEALARAFPWVLDPALEEPTLSRETFEALETERALAVCAQRPPSLDLLCESLLDARRAAGDVPLRVVLIPDEFQVEDDVWATVQRRAGRELERDLPQRLLGAWLAEQGFPYLDLLPVMRAVEPLADGRRHLYHLQDTHFNARGNDVAARALAEFVR